MIGWDLGCEGGMMSDRASVFDSEADFEVSGFVPLKPPPAGPKETVEKV